MDKTCKELKQAVNSIIKIGQVNSYIDNYCSIIPCNDELIFNLRKNSMLAFAEGYLTSFSLDDKKSVMDSIDLIINTMTELTRGCDIYE